MTKRAIDTEGYTYSVTQIVSGERYNIIFVSNFEVPTWPIVKTWRGDYDVSDPPITAKHPNKRTKGVRQILQTHISYIMRDGEIYHNDMTTNREKVYTWLWILSKSSVIKIPHDVAVLIGKRLLHTRPILK